MWAPVKKQALGLEEALRGELGGLRQDEMRLLDKFVLSGVRTMNLPLSDYAADSLQRRSLIRSVGRPTLGDEQTFAVPQDVWNTWKGMLARRA
jgi:hypothetical protein